MCPPRRGADRDFCLFLWVVVEVIALAVIVLLYQAG
jgi:hypothetical protein